MYEEYQVAHTDTVHISVYLCFTQRYIEQYNLSWGGVVAISQFASITAVSNRPDHTIFSVQIKEYTVVWVDDGIWV